MKDFHSLKLFSLIFFLFAGCSKTPQELKEESEKLYNSAIEYYERGYFDKAEEFFIKVISIEREIKLTDYSPETFLYLGLISTENADFEIALAYYNESRNLFKQKFNRKREGLLENNIGNIYAQLGQFRKAGEHFRNALGISQISADKEGEAVANLNIGSLYAEMRDFQQAFNYYNKAYDAYRIIEDIEGEVISSNKIGEAFLRFGAANEALESFDFAYQLAKDFRLNNLLPPIINNAGLSYLKIGNSDIAKLTFESGINLLLNSGDDPITLWTLYNNLGDVFLLAYQYSNAIAEYNEAVSIAEKYGEGLQAGILKLKIAQAYFLDGISNNDNEKIKSAEKIFSDVTILFEKTNFNSGLIETYSGLTLTSHILNNIDKSIEYINKVNNILNVEYYGIKNNITENYALLPEIFNPSLFYDILIKKGKYKELIENSFNWKNYKKAKFLFGLNEVYFENDNDKIAYDSIKSNEREISFLKFEIANQVSRFGGYQNSKRLKNLNNLLKEKNKNFNSKKLLSAYLTNIKLNYEFFQNRLKTNEAFLNYFVSPENITLIIIDKNNIKPMTLNINSDGINRQVLSISESISKNNSNIFQDLSKGLYVSLIKPIETQISNKEKLIINIFENDEDKISLLPFHSLTDENGNYLSEKYQITYYGGIITETKNNSENLVVYEPVIKNEVKSIKNIPSLETSKTARDILLKSNYNKLFLLNPVYLSIKEPVSSYIEMYSDSVSIPELNISAGMFNTVKSDNLFLFTLFSDFSQSGYFISDLLKANNIIVNQFSINTKTKINYLNKFIELDLSNNFYKQLSSNNGLDWASFFIYKKL